MPYNDFFPHKSNVGLKHMNLNFIGAYWVDFFYRDQNQKYLLPFFLYHLGCVCFSFKKMNFFFVFLKIDFIKLFLKILQVFYTHFF
jgi:hypothetical protein